MSDPELITAAVTASGLSAGRFAALVAFGRDRRTLARWKSGDTDIPRATRERLQWFLALSDRRRRALVALLST